MTSRIHYRAGIAAAFLLAGLLAGCGSSSETAKEGETPVKGPRIAVLAYDTKLESDTRLAGAKVTLPAAHANADWSNQGGDLSHNPGHLQMSDAPRKIWETSVGSGSSRTARLYGEPIVAGGIIYAMDPASRITAIDAASGKKVWSAQITMRKEKADTGAGGGIAVANGKLFATTGYGIAAAYDAASGHQLWQHDTKIPLRGAPAASGDLVYVVTHDNQMFALSAADGGQKWAHAGIPENASVLGTAAPAVVNGLVIVPYSSGELFALKADTGQPVWVESVSRGGQLTPLSTLNDIDGEPVVDDDHVYAISQSGRMVSINAASGERSWENNIGGVHTPVVAGDYIFLVSNENQVVCLTKSDGRVLWVTQLARFEKPEKRKNLIQWTGPVLASDRLVVASSQGYLLSISPYSGKVLSGLKVADKIYNTPILAGGTLYVLADNARLIAFR